MNFLETTARCLANSPRARRATTGVRRLSAGDHDGPEFATSAAPQGAVNSSARIVVQWVVRRRAPATATEEIEIPIVGCLLRSPAEREEAEEPVISILRTLRRRFRRRAGRLFRGLFPSN